MSTGRRYEETRSLRLPEVAQQMRADVARLRSEGRLPAHAVVSVRVDQKGAGTGSIDITVSGLRDTEIWRTPGVTEVHTRNGHGGGLTPLGRQITDALNDIHTAYGYDRSDTMTDYFDVRYYGGVRILNEESQRAAADQKARQSTRAAINRAARQAADALPLRVTLVGDRAARLVITDTGTGHEVAIVDAKGYSRAFLTASFVEYLLGAYGWEVVRFHRRSKTNPVSYWSVRRATAAEPVDTAPAPVAAVVPSTPATEPAEEGQAVHEIEDQDVAGLVELDPANWADLDPDHWAARWVRDAQTWPADDPARLWSQAIATLTAAGYRHERHDAPATVDHTARLVTTDARNNVAAEAAELTQQAAAVLDRIATDIHAIYPHARPIVLDGTGLSGTRCETGCGALARWSMPNPSTHQRTPSRLGYCPTCLLAHAHPTTPAPAPPTTTDADTGTPADHRTPAEEPTEPEQPAEPGELEEFNGATILHTAETGTLLLGTTKGDGSYDILTTAGQRWRGLRHGDYAGALFLPHTHDRAANRYTINRTAELLRAAGWTVRICIDEAQRYQTATEAVDRNAAEQDSLQVIARRIECHTAEEARIQRGLTGYQRRFRRRDGYLVEDHPAATGVYREQLLVELTHVRAALAADRQTLADMTAAGTWRPVDPTTIKPDDAIRTRGRWEKVVRVNRTTVSVATGYNRIDRMSFPEITGHRPAARSRMAAEVQAPATRAPDADNLVSVSDTPKGSDMSADQSPPTLELVGISIIAGWFGVTRPAVAHWMERHPNFPAPDVRIRQPSTKPNGQVSYVYGWRPEREAEIREWERSRPGQGAGGGRPWPAKTSEDTTGGPPSRT